MIGLTGVEEVVVVMVVLLADWSGLEGYLKSIGNSILV